MEQSKEIQELNDLLRPRWVSGLWNVDHAERPSDPRTRVKAHLWKWQDIHDSLLQARDKISVASGSVERRVIRLVNPGMAESEMTSHTILLSFQLIQPGEVAPAHRHTMSAFRFILQGHGAYTNVDGQKMVMEDGDLILTPQSCWHEHAHEGDENMVWIDGLDVPFVQALNQISFDPYGGRLPISESIDPAAWYGMTRPIGDTTPTSPRLLHYHWRDTYPSLQRLGRTPGSPFDGAALEFVNLATRRFDVADHVMPGSDAASERKNQSAPSHQHEHLSRLSRQRHNIDQWREFPLAKRRHVHRTALVLARTRQCIVNGRSDSVFDARRADTESFWALSRGNSVNTSS